MAKMAASTLPTITCAVGNALSSQPQLGLGPVQRLSAPSEHLDGQLSQLSLHSGSLSSSPATIRAAVRALEGGCALTQGAAEKYRRKIVPG